VGLENFLYNFVLNTSMNKVDRLLEEKFMIGIFSFSVFPKFKVKVKEVIKKHNKEINWEFSEKNERDANGDRIVTLELKTGNESAEGFNEKMDFFVGLIEDIYDSTGSYIDEETANKYNTGFIGAVIGEEAEKIEGIESKNIHKKSTYYYRELYNAHLIILGDINKIIEIEKKYPKVIRRIYGELVQEWYEKHVDVIKKTFVNKEELKRAQVIVEMLEKNSNVQKIPYKLKKFRFSM